MRRGERAGPRSRGTHRRTGRDGAESPAIPEGSAGGPRLPRRDFRRRPRRLVTLVGALAAPLSLVSALAAPAAEAAQAVQAAQDTEQVRDTAADSTEGYRYWSFWERDGDGAGWSYATQGPATVRPGDGDAIGLRFAVSEDSEDARKPRGQVDFDTACADTEQKSGSKRIAVRVDSGTQRDAADGERPPKPRTECASVDEDATAADALAAVTDELRYSSDSLLCAIDGYPESGCGDRVSDGDSTSGPSSADGGASAAEDGGDEADGGLPTGVGFGLGAAAVLALAAAAGWQTRRRRE